MSPRRLLHLLRLSLHSLFVVCIVGGQRSDQDARVDDAQSHSDLSSAR